MIWEFYIIFAMVMIWTLAFLPFINLQAWMNLRDSLLTMLFNIEQELEELEREYMDKKSEIERRKNGGE